MNGVIKNVCVENGMVYVDFEDFDGFSETLILDLSFACTLNQYLTEIL